MLWSFQFITHSQHANTNIFIGISEWWQDYFGSCLYAWNLARGGLMGKSTRNRPPAPRVQWPHRTLSGHVTSSRVQPGMQTTNRTDPSWTQTCLECAWAKHNANSGPIQVQFKMDSDLFQQAVLACFATQGLFLSHRLRGFWRPYEHCDLDLRACSKP